MKKYTEQERNKFAKEQIKAAFLWYEKGSIAETGILGRDNVKYDNMFKHLGLTGGFEVGKIAVTKLGAIIFVKEITGDKAFGYGFDVDGDWFDYLGEGRSGYTYLDMFSHEATSEEWEKALRLKLERDYPEGTEYVSLVGNSIGNIDASKRFDYYANCDQLTNGASVYLHGEWAKKIDTTKDMTVEQIQEVLGFRVRIIESK